ncbi:MAG: TPM domain-containing protein [Phenylobacterium sp.]
MKHLTPEDLSAIEAAVRDAEARTTGEIYCVVAHNSSHYSETPLAWAAGVALLGPAVLLLAGVHVTIPDFFSTWTASDVSVAIESAVRSALIGAIVTQGVLFVLAGLIVEIPAVRFRLTPKSVKRQRVKRRAAEQFAAKNLHATRGRTGVLIFVSLEERMAELIADEGIADHVDAHVWDKAMAALTDGLKLGEPAAGFQAAIGLCANVLADKFPASADDNPNEIPDAVVLLPRH